MFHSWMQMPADLKLTVIVFAFTEDAPITSYRHRRNLMSGSLNLIVDTQNKEPVQLALDICESPSALCRIHIQ